MKNHYCPVEKTEISFEGECNWCGEVETVTFGKHHKGMLEAMKKPKPLSDEEIMKIIGTFSVHTINYMDFARAIEERHGIK